ncbi:MAG TPA: zf-TFIIB domain-containing protein [Candidatus Saccharimonadales bacterium]|nr:zf-TFIIB domain-containing protein [Candidatus Saccharimonadales bacterium]
MPYTLTVLVLVIVIATGIGAFLWRRFSIRGLLSRGDSLAGSPDDSAIIAYYTAGNLLTAAGRSKLNGMKYSSYVVMPDGDGTYVDDVSAIIALDLPFNTSVHLVGLSKQHRIDRVAFADFLRANGMEAVELEGDFPDYFELYAAKGQQVSARQIMNPRSMQFAIDYCRSHFWEVNASELYVVATGHDKQHDSIIDDSQRFVSLLRPALLPGQPGAAPVHHEVPYGEYDGPPLPCPICRQAMRITDNWQRCPAGHGILLDGKDLVRLRHGRLKIDNDPKSAAPHEQLICPNCHNPMVHVDYQDSGVVIDSCEHCPFRWLDADEVTAIEARE